MKGGTSPPLAVAFGSRFEKDPVVPVLTRGCSIRLVCLLALTATGLEACGTFGEAPPSPVVASSPPLAAGQGGNTPPLSRADAGAWLSSYQGQDASGDGAPPPPGPAGSLGPSSSSSSAPAPPLPSYVAPSLLLPWTGGETWYLTSGPHSHNRAALDFAPPNFNPRTKRRFEDPCSRLRGNPHWVRAAAAGRITAVLRADCPVVQIEHDDGTATNYFHLRRKSVKALGLKVGDVVEAGQILGHPSCETGPKKCGATHPPSGAHLHFYRTTVGKAKRLPADGMVLSGWRVHAVGRIREGTMTKGDEIRSTRGSAVGRACSPTLGICDGQRNDLESDNATVLDNGSVGAGRAKEMSLDRGPSGVPAAQGPAGRWTTVPAHP